MRKNIYDIYDLAGNKVIGEMTGSEIAQALNVNIERIAKCSSGGTSLLGRYKVVKVGEKESKNTSKKNEDDAFKRRILNEWETIIAPFKKVIWVKEYGPGVRRLKHE